MSQADPYASRFEAEPRIVRRRDPVLYDPEPGAPDSVLSDRWARFFEEKGYLTFQSVFSRDEVAELSDELERLRADPRLRDAPQVVAEQESREVRSIFEVHALSSVFHRLSRDARMVGVVRRILGSPVYIHQSRVNYKPGFEGREFYWHSDFETWHMEDGMPRMRAVSCAVSLTENNDFNGPLMLVPGSHKLYVTCVGETPREHYKQSLRKQEYGVPSRDALRTLVDRGGIVAAKGPPGSVTFFDCNMMHGSAGNMTPWPRSNVFFVYNSVANALVEPFCGLPPRPEYIAARASTAPVEAHSTPRRPETRSAGSLRF